MFIKKFILRAAGGSLAAIILLAVQPLAAQTTSDSERLQKLERAVEQLQKRNAELEQEISSLKKQTSFAPLLSPAGKSKTLVTSDGKTYVEKAVVEEEKKPVYVVPGGPEIKLVLGGFIQANFEDGDVSAFEGRFGLTALKDRFRLRRTGINFQRRKLKSANGKHRSVLSRLLPIRSSSSSSGACPPARSRRSDRSARSSGANHSPISGRSRKTWSLTTPASSTATDATPPLTTITT